MPFWSIFGRRRNVDFFDLLQQQADTTIEGCTALVGFLETGTGAQDVVRLEEEADTVRRILIDELNQTFITPVDREDIFAFARAMDDVMDHALDTVSELEVFELVPNESLIAMAKLLQNGAEELGKAIKHLKKNPNVAVEHVLRAKRIEKKMRHLFLHAIKTLFSGGEIPVILSYREVYSHFNRSAGKVEDAANIISDIMVKMQ